jgi:hypothetical protein
MNIQILGIRHHSPACARRVRELIQTQKPACILIEGPSDFNQRLDELALPHRLPIALYSYAHTDAGPAQCWYPFLDYSPEWVALKTGRELGLAVRFIDLPHWHYRAKTEKTQSKADRYQQVSEAFCRRFQCDGDDALWDHLFEAAPAEELPERLALYFDELRGDDPGSADDRLREDFMARHIAASIEAGGGSVLVICGGWHKPALERLWRIYAEQGLSEAPTCPLPEENQAGSYLVPFEFRQVDALAGYGAGMQSPLFYQWCWEAGRAAAIANTTAQVVQRLRAKRVAVSTAEFVSLEQSIQSLGQLRGHQPPTRADFLDGVLSAVVKEALEQRPPWSERGLLTGTDHPVLREALLALTGDGRGKLDGATPQPPLLKDAERHLETLDLLPTRQARLVKLDRREASDRPRAETLWRLKILGVSGIDLKELKAVRGLPEDLRYEEHWQLVQTERWYPDLIEASIHGASLAQAAENALLANLSAAPASPDRIAQLLSQSLRAGFHSLGENLARELTRRLPHIHAHGELAKAGLPLLELAQTGFWGQDTQGLLAPALRQIGEHLLWLLDGVQVKTSPAIEGDTDAVHFLTSLMKLAPPSFDTVFALDTLTRIAHRQDGPPALHGAALGAVYGLGHASAEQVTARTRAVPPRDELGDFLFGLFSAARELATQDDLIVAAIQAALDDMAHDDFLIALPQLRAAFAWFPPRERGAIARRVAELLGLSQSEQFKLLRLPSGLENLLDAKKIEAQALAWAREIGLVDALPLS